MLKLLDKLVVRHMDWRWSRQLTNEQKLVRLEERVVELENALNKEFRDHQLTAAVAEARLDEMERLAGILKANGLENTVRKWVIIAEEEKG